MNAPVLFDAAGREEKKFTSCGLRFGSEKKFFLVVGEIKGQKLFFTVLTWMGFRLSWMLAFLWLISAARSVCCLAASYGGREAGICGGGYNTYIV